MAKKKAPLKITTQPLKVKPNPLEPSLTLLLKLGSAIVHADEYLSPHGHPLDKDEFHQLLKDPELVEWLAAMTKLALVPRKRNP